MTASPRTRSERKRIAILDGAREAFRTDGFQGTTMDDVARLANVSKRTVYNHFPSKDELFIAVLEGLISSDAREPLVYQTDTPVRDQLTRFAEAKMCGEITPEFLGLFRAIVGELARTPELLTSIVPKVSMREAELLTWLVAAHKDGTLDVTNPGRAALQFYALLKGTLFYPVLVGLRPFPSAQEQSDEIQEAVAMFLGRYGTGKIDPGRRAARP